MAAPDFYFAVNAMFRYLHDRYGKSELVRYWRRLGQEYYRSRIEQWRRGGATAIAQDWTDYFAQEPGAKVEVKTFGDEAVELDIAVCPAIKHLRDHGRDIVPYFCEHCDHVCGTMAEAAGFSFERIGGMGSCVQRFVKLRINGEAV
jgi:hypothetical protein